jgi:hypothetical protein
MQIKKFLTVIPALALSAAIAVAQEPQPQPTQTQTQTSVGQPTDTNEPVYKGCVSGTKDNYTLTSSDGQSFRLHSDKDIAEHVGKMVEIRGTVKKEGADRPADATPASTMQEIDVADLKNVEGSCPTSGASNDMPQSDASKSSEQASATKTDETAAQPTASEPAAAASTTDQPATETQPAASASASTSTEAQPAASANAEVKTETPAADASANAATSTDQSAAASTSTDASANNATDQNATAATGNEQKTDSDAAQLPQTASPLPLLGLLGFASTGLGFFLRRK